MVSAYRVADITTSQVDRAFALVHAADAHAELSTWRRTCEDMIAARREGRVFDRLIVCENANGYLKGLCLVRRREMPDVHLLDVSLYVVMTVVDEDGVRQAIRHHLQTLATDAGCRLMPISD